MSNEIFEKEVTEKELCTDCVKEVEENKEICVVPEETDTIASEVVSDNKKTTKINKKKKPSNAPYILGMLASVVVIILGVVLFSGTFNSWNGILNADPLNTTYTLYSYYGGDAYTGIQHAAADTSRNVAVAVKGIERTNDVLEKILYAGNDIQSIISSSMGLLIISIGLLGFFGFLAGLNRNKYMYNR